MASKITSTESFRPTQSASEIGLYIGDAMDWYDEWPVPIVIVSDGPYGLGSYPGDLPTSDGLAEWYLPHIEKWSQRATLQTTLWFWNSEIGWATVHPILASHGWQYRACHVWDKGKAHVAGNANTKTLRMFPVVTEVCVQYVREPQLALAGQRQSIQEWLRTEWMRTGLPFRLANEACGVKNAATRKYLTADHLWYHPPTDAFERLVDYANRHGDPGGTPYFSINGRKPMMRDEWDRMRAKFHCEYGVSNVWREPPVNGSERLKVGGRAVHINQKPLRLLEICLRASSDEGDVIWEPFGGLCSVAVAAQRLGRLCYSAEVNESFFVVAYERLLREFTVDLWPGPS